jgi:transcriptional regulator with XRE-family HTH domain
MHSTLRVEQHQPVAVPIAQVVRHLRAKRSWTLDEVAARSGISRRLIVQIEQAQANPSIGTLERLANAFQVSLRDLLPEQTAASAGVRPAGDELRLWTGPRGGAGLLQVRHGPVELWSWTLKPGESHEGEPHPPGAIELLLVTAGALRLDVGVETFRLEPGDSGWFDASIAHAYRNQARTSTRFTMVVFAP